MSDNTTTTTYTALAVESSQWESQVEKFQTEVLPGILSAFHDKLHQTLQLHLDNLRKETSRCFSTDVAFVDTLLKTSEEKLSSQLQEICSEENFVKKCLSQAEVEMSAQNPKFKALSRVLKIQSYIRGWSQRVKYAQIVKSYTMRYRVVKEIIDSEKSYIEGLNTLREVFYIPLKESLQTQQPLLTPDELSYLFDDLELIYPINIQLEKSLAQRIDEWGPTQKIGDIFLQMSPMFKIYTQYVTNYERALITFSKLEKGKNQKFAQFIKKQQNFPELKKLPFNAFQILPVQRIPRYMLLIRELLKFTEPDHVDYKDLSEALKKVSAVNEFIDRSKKNAENQTRMFEIQQITDCKNLIQPHRQYIDEGYFKVQIISDKNPILLPNSTRSSIQNIAAATLATSARFSNMSSSDSSGSAFPAWVVLFNDALLISVLLLQNKPFDWVLPRQSTQSILQTIVKSPDMVVFKELLPITGGTVSSIKIDGKIMGFRLSFEKRESKYDFFTLNLAELGEKSLAGIVADTIGSTLGLTQSSLPVETKEKNDSTDSIFEPGSPREISNDPGSPNSGEKKKREKNNQNYIKNWMKVVSTAIKDIERKKESFTAATPTRSADTLNSSLSPKSTISDTASAIPSQSQLPTVPSHSAGNSSSTSTPGTSSTDEKKETSPPVSHWFYFRDEKWVPLGQSISQSIEEGWQHVSSLPQVKKPALYVQNQAFKVNYNRRTIKTNNEFQSKYTIRRGTWFWQDDDTSVVPYPEEIAELLESAFTFGKEKTVEIMKKPLRVVQKFPDGVYKQIRKTKNGNASGRIVIRGYPGKSSISTTAQAGTPSTKTSTSESQSSTEIPPRPFSAPPDDSSPSHHE